MQIKKQKHNKIYYFLLIIVSFYNLPLLCMDQISHADKIIEDYYGDRFTMPASTIGLVNLFANAANFEEESPIDYAFSKKEFDFQYHDWLDDKFKSVNTNSQPFFSFFERKAGDVPLSRRTLLKAFDCIKQPELCIKPPKLSPLYEKDAIKSFFTVVNYLQPQKEKVLRKLAQRMKIVIPHEELDEDDQIDCIVLSRMYEKSIGKIIKNKPQDTYFNPSKPFRLNFKNMNIESLYGFKNLKIDKNKIEVLKLTNNKLTTLNIKNLLEELPNLRKIRVENNEINVLVFPKRLPEKMHIRLWSNQIKELPEFHMSDKSILSIVGNSLSKDAREKIKKALRPSFIKRNYHYLYLLKDISLTFLVGNLEGEAGSIFFELIDLALNYKNYKFNLSNFIIGSITGGLTNIGWQYYMNTLSNYKSHRIDQVGKIFS